MKRLLHISFVILISIFLSSCIVNKTIDGNGDLQRKDIDIKNQYKKISISGGFDLILRHNESDTVSIWMESNLHSFIKTEVKDETIIISEVRGYNVNTTIPIEIYLNIDEFRKINVSGSSNIICDEFSTTNLKLVNSGYCNFTCDSLSAEYLTIEVSGTGKFNSYLKKTKTLSSSISGSGKISCSGYAENTNFNISGDGKIYCINLESKICDISVSGHANAEINVSELLKVNVSGDCNIMYKGEPLIDDHVSGDLDIKKY